MLTPMNSFLQRVLQTMGFVLAESKQAANTNPTVCKTKQLQHRLLQ